jgi:hypothetical protein
VFSQSSVSKFIFILRSVPGWLRVIATVGLCVLISGTLYWYGERPLCEKCAQVVVFTKTITQRNSLLAKIIPKKIILEKQKSVLNEQLASLVRASQVSEQIVVEKLLVMLKKHNISCKDLTPVCAKKGFFWKKHKFNLIFKGSFKNIESLLEEFFASLAFVTYSKLSLVRLQKHKIKGEIKLSFITFGNNENESKIFFS